MYPHHSHHQSTTTFSSIYMTSAQAIFGRRCAPFSAPLTCCCVCVQYNAIAIWLYLPREFFMALYEAVTTVIFFISAYTRGLHRQNCASVDFVRRSLRAKAFSRTKITYPLQSRRHNQRLKRLFGRRRRQIIGL